MNILFVCTANKNRSKTAEHHFAKENPWHKYKSAGTLRYLAEQNGVHLTREHMMWADKVVCMEKCHKKDIEQRFGNRFNNKVTVLRIQDVYNYNDPELIKELKTRVDFV